MQALLELENEPALVELACPKTGVLAWPALRNDVFRLLLSDRLYPGSPIIDLEQRPRVRRVLYGAGRAGLHNARNRVRPSDILILATGAGLLARDGRMYNRYADPFAELLGDRAWTMETLLGDRWPRKPRSSQRLGFLAVDRLRELLAMQTRVTAADRRLAAQVVDIVVASGRSKLGWWIAEPRQRVLVAAGARRLAAYPLRARQAQRLLEVTRAKLVLMEDAAFGRHAVFNAIARDHGVHVAEFQHGMITPGHDAYNVHARLETSVAYRRTQPRTLLTFGAWWSRQFNAPVERVAVGNPHRTEALASWQPAPVRDVLLVIGDGVETERYVDLCVRLADVAPPNHRVVFRPHPRERDIAASAARRVALDDEPDVYRSFETASAVISESSTALFEAVGLVPRVLAWDTPKSRFYLGDHPFAAFHGQQDFARVLARAEVLDDRGLLMWEGNWRDRLVSFVDRTIAAGSTPRSMAMPLT